MNSDQTFVGGRTKENARRLIGLAKEAGLPVSAVQAQTGGFLVPTSILEDEKKPSSTPAKKKAAKKTAASTKE